MKLHFLQTTWSHIANPFDVVKEATVTFLVQAAYGFAQEIGTALSRHRCWRSHFFEGRCHSQHNSYDRQNMRRWPPSVTYNMIVENVVPSSAVPSRNRKRWSMHDKPTWDTVRGRWQASHQILVYVSPHERVVHDSPIDPCHIWFYVR